MGHLQTQAAMATWLSTFEWDYFCTLTFSHPRRSNALSLVPRWIERSHFLDPMGDCLAWFAEEYHSDGERLHLHGLLHSSHGVEWERLRRAWIKIGRCKIERYDPSRGAVDYCAKYIAKDAVGRGDWQLFEWSEGRRV